MASCKIKILDEVHCVLIGLHQNHIDYFCDKFAEQAPNYYFNPKYQLGQWDGYIRYFHKTGKTYVNLLDQIVPKVIQFGYKINLIDQRESNTVSPDYIDEDFFSHITDPETNEPIKVRHYQIDLVNNLLKNGHGVGVAGTGAGKTLMTAALVKTYGDQNLRVITIVPDKNLVLQTAGDLKFFGIETGVYFADQKDTSTKHVVSTWQSLQNNPKLIQSFDVVVVDECHKVKGNVLKKLLNDYGNNIKYRFGVTGTMPKEAADVMSVKICLGEQLYSIEAHQLIDEGWLSKLNIDIMEMQVDLQDEYEKFCEDLKRDSPNEQIPTYRQFKNSYFPDWFSEKKFLQREKDRLEWIATFLKIKNDERKGNLLCLVNGVNFGKKLSSMVEGSYFIHGKDKMKTRQNIYELFENNNDVLVIATVNIASTGLNIKRIFNLVYIDVGKSFIRTIQTIGRGLRKAKDKDEVKVTDICSDLKYSRRHLNKRIQYYKEAKYPYRRKKVDYSSKRI